MPGSAPTRLAKMLEDVRWTAMTFRTAARKRSFGDRLGAAGARSVLRLSTLFRVASNEGEGRRSTLVVSLV
jgi:hypothetical protein